MNRQPSCRHGKSYSCFAPNIRTNNDCHITIIRGCSHKCQNITQKCAVWESSDSTRETMNLLLFFGNTRGESSSMGTTLRTIFVIPRCFTIWGHLHLCWLPQAYSAWPAASQATSFNRATPLRHTFKACLVEKKHGICFVLTDRAGGLDVLASSPSAGRFSLNLTVLGVESKACR